MRFRKFTLKPYTYYPNGSAPQVGYTCRHAEVCQHYLAWMLWLDFLNAFDARWWEEDEYSDKGIMGRCNV